MDEIIKIDAKEAGNKLAVLKHYFQEILLIVFAIALVALFNFREHDNKIQREEKVVAEARYDALAQRLEKYLIDGQKIMVETVAENTQVLNRVLDYLESVKK